MFYYLHSFWVLWSPLWVLRYVTVRAVLGAGTAFLLCVLFGPAVIHFLKRLKFGQYERKEEAPPLYALHAKKEGTPTMGGILILGSVAVSAVLWVDVTNRLLLMTLATMLAMGAVGFHDDWLKIRRRQSKGLSIRQKMALQTGWGMVIALMLLALPETRESARALMAPFFKKPIVQDLGVVGTVAFVCLVLTASANAVNLTDGLDGLAIGCSCSVAISYLVLAYAAGHAIFADYLLIPHVPGAGELAVFCGCLAGACLGFLWHNCYPASVFMGDTGSLGLGGAIAMVAILIKQEILLVLVGGVFVLEALSVIIQVASFRLRGKRVFAMAPLHHHFELRKWSETQVTVRFWILSIIFALLGILTLKLR